LRAVGVKQPLAQGEERAIEIEFDTGHLDMTLQVEAADARAHSHAGHQH
jgi:copper(I)-binding protein